MKEEIKKLEGKTISKINYYSTEINPDCIESIEFNDGTILELSGRADDCTISRIV